VTVSVVIPCFNYGRFLSQAVDSVLAQTLAPQELVIVNDGSTDDTLAIAQSYADQHDHIRVLDITNRDMPNALNAGLIALSPVDRVAILDADNWLELNYLAATCSHDADAVVAAIRKHPGPDTATLPGVLDPSAQQLWEWCWTNSCAVFRYDALAEVGGFHGLMSGDYDWDVWIDFALHGFSVAYCDTTYCHYRIHPDSYTQTQGQRRQYGHRIEMWRHHRLGEREGFEWIQPEYPSLVDLENEQADREAAALAGLWKSPIASS